MNITGIKYFVTIAKCGSISKAAEKLYITQPALSRYIQRLERELGVQLFERSANNCRLTAAGYSILDDAEELLRQADRIVSKINGYCVGETGSIVIGYCGNEGQVLYRLVRLIQTEHPGVEIKLRKDYVANLSKYILNCEIDFAFLYHVSDYPVMRAKKVRESRILMVVAKDHRFADKKVVSIEELRAEKFVMSEREIEPKFYDTFLQVCKSSGFLPEIAQTENDSDAIFSYVLSSGNIGLIPSSIRYLVDSSLLSCVDIEDKNGELLPDHGMSIAWNIQNKKPCIGGIAETILLELSDTE